MKILRQFENVRKPVRGKFENGLQDIASPAAKNVAAHYAAPRLNMLNED
jgi:hypothetical protein